MARNLKRIFVSIALLGSGFMLGAIALFLLTSLAGTPFSSLPNFPLLAAMWVIVTVPTLWVAWGLLSLVNVPHRRWFYVFGAAATLGWLAGGFAGLWSLVDFFLSV